MISNSCVIARRLRRSCNHEHKHVKFKDRRAKAAALYLHELCIEMCKGLREQLDYDAKGLKCLGELSQKDMGGGFSAANYEVRVADESPARSSG